jgi:hypothetical protein
VGTGSREENASKQKAKASVPINRNGGFRRLRRRNLGAPAAVFCPKTGKRRNLGTFKSRAAAEKHEREVQYFKRH